MVNGSAIRQYHLVRALAARHRVDLAAFSAPNAPSPSDVEHLRSFCASVTVIPRSAFTPVPGTPSMLWSSTPRSLVRTDDPAVRALVADRLRTADVAVGFALSSARYLEGASVPAIFEEAEPRQIRNQIDRATTVTRRLRGRLTWWKHARYLKRLIDSVAAVTVVSDEERAALVDIGVDAARVRLIPNGADARDLARARTTAVPARLIHPGSITYAPNLEAVVWFLANVMPKIRAARPDVELWVTGATGDLPIERIPNAGWARFTGPLPEVKTAIGGSTVTVVPLLSGGGTRLKVLESMALGTPVVSTSKGAEGLEVTDGEHLLIGDAPEAFADRVLAVVNDPALAGRLSSAARARVESRYTWDAIGRAFCGVVEAAAHVKERR